MNEPCAFCGCFLTTATLTDGTPICWRPCYSALLKVQGGQEPHHALMESIDQAREPGNLLIRLRDTQFSVGATAERIDRWARGWRNRSMLAPGTKFLELEAAEKRGEK